MGKRYGVRLFFLVVLLLSLLVACDEGLEKPTGLENEKQTETQVTNTTEETGDYTIVQSIVVSETEIPLPPSEQTVEAGDTVFDALVALTKEHGIHLDYRGGQGTGIYINGLANVYEFDRGNMSGWQYRINGVFPDRGVAHVTLCDGDRIEWLYTTDPNEYKVSTEPFRKNGVCP